MNLRQSLLGGLAFLCGALAAPAQTVYTWTGNNVTEFDGYYYAADAMDPANWAGGIAPPSDGSATGSSLVFGATSGSTAGSLAIYWSADTNFSGLTFTDPFPDYYLSSGSYYSTLGIGAGGITVGGAGGSTVTFGYLNGLTLLASQTWTVNGNLTIGVPISDVTGTETLTKTGDGILTMQDTSSTFGGGLTVRNGTLEIGGNSNSDGTVYSGPVGTGTLTMANGTTLGAIQWSDTTLGNALALGTGVTIGNSYDSFRYYLTGPVMPLNQSTTLLLGSGNPVFFNGGIADAAAGPTTLTFSSAPTSYNQNGVAVLGGTNTYTGGTVADGTGVIFYTPSALPATGSISAVNQGYVGTAYSGGMTGIISHISAPGTFNGSLGFDTDPQVSSIPTTFTDTVNLAAFSNDPLVFSGLGTQTSAILTGAITPPTGGNYIFGGGSGTLQVQSDLTAPTGVRVHSTENGSILTVWLQGNNSFTGTLLVDHSVVVLDSASALPAGVGYQLDDNAYLGYTENFTGAANATAFISRLNAPNYNSTSVIGFDTSAANADSPRIVNDMIDLSQLGDIYIGSSTNVILAGTIVAPSTGQLSVTGVNGGQVAINSALTADNVNSLNVGGTDWKFSDRGYVQLNSGDSTYAGGTTLNSGYLLVGASSSGSVDGIVSGPLGTGTLTFANDYVSNPLVLAAAGPNITLQNDIKFADGVEAQFGVAQTTDSTNSAYSQQSYVNYGLTLTGRLSGNPDTLAIVGNGTYTLSGDNRCLNTSEFDIGSDNPTGAPLVIAANDHALGSNTSMVCLNNGADLQFTTLNPSVGSLMGGTASSDTGDQSFIALLDGATLTINQTQDATLAASIGGLPQSYNSKAESYVTDFAAGQQPSVNAALVKNGDATLTLTGQSNYSGGTTINAGTIVAASSTSLDSETQAIIAGPLGTGTVTLNGGQLTFSGPVTEGTSSEGITTHAVISTGVVPLPSFVFANPIIFGANGGTLSGSVAFTSTITVGPNVTLSPGGPGVMGFASGLTFAGGGTYNIGIYNMSAAAGAGYDTVIVSGGTFDITATDATPFSLHLTSLSSTGVAGLLGTNPTDPMSLLILQAPSAITGYDGANLVLDTSDFSSPLAGNFSLSLGGEDNDQLLLDFTPVPEPSTCALLAVGLGFIVVAARRRRRTGSA